MVQVLERSQKKAPRKAVFTISEVFTLLPILLISKLKELFDGKNLNLAIKVCSTIYHKYILNKMDFEEYNVLSKSYKLLMVNNNNGNYKIIYNPLKKNDILQKFVYKDGTTFSKLNHLACKYRINPSYLTGELAKISYTTKKNNKSKSKKTDYEIPNGFKINLEKLKATYTTENEIDSILTEHWNYILNKVESKTYTTPKIKKLKYKANSKSDPLEIIDKSEFIESRAFDLRNRYKVILNMALSNTIEPKRNSTNFRLDYLLTNFPKIFVNLLELDSEPITEIDLANSQLCIFFNYLDQVKLRKGFLLDLVDPLINNYLFKLDNNSNISNNSSKSGNTYYCSDFWSIFDQKDVRLFKELVYDGVIYDKLVLLSIESGKEKSRIEIKTLVFELIFGKYKSYKVNESNILNQNFPNVIKLIKSLKMIFEHLMDLKELEPIRSLRSSENEDINDLNYKSGNNYFPILLQRLESRIFIDHLLPKLYNKGICCLPKHDSILVCQSQRSKTLNLMNNELFNIFDNNFKLNCKQ